MTIKSLATILLAVVKDNPAMVEHTEALNKLITNKKCVQSVKKTESKVKKH